MGLVELGESVKKVFLSAITANTVCSASSRWSSLLKWPVKSCKNDCMRSSCAGVPTVFCISLWHLFTAKHTLNPTVSVQIMPRAGQRAYNHRQNALRTQVRDIPDEALPIALEQPVRRLDLVLRLLDALRKRADVPAELLEVRLRVVQQDAH